MGGEVVSSHDVVLVSIIIVERCRCHCRQSMVVMMVPMLTSPDADAGPFSDGHTFLDDSLSHDGEMPP